MSPQTNLLVTVLLGGFLISVILAFVARRRRATRLARSAAEKAGLAARDVRREVAVSRDRARTWQVEDVSCVEYSLPMPLVSESTWRLLMRPGEKHDGLEPGWRLEIGAEPLPHEVRDTLQVIMSDGLLEGEFFEFEGRRDSVAVFWDEWGGPAMTDHLAAYLKTLANSTDVIRRF